MSSNRLRGILLPLVLLSALFSLTTVFAAEPPKITIAPLWRPGTTLDTFDVNKNNINDDTDDDFRYVDVDIYVTTTVQFWSVQLTCAATPAALTSYNDPDADGDDDNDIEPVIWGTAWGVEDTDFVGVEDAYNPTTGARTITASRLGNRYPMGGANGTRDIFLLATLRYRAKDVALNANAAFTCTSSFLNRNGKPVLVATYTPPPPLPVLTGYVASGTVLYQGRAAHAGITVDCDYLGDPTKDFAVQTAATGAWSYITRAQGYYTCSFYGDTSAPVTMGYKPDRYLGARTAFDLRGLSYNMLPVTLVGGNVNFDSTDGNPSTPDEQINFNDIVTITLPTNWNKAVTAGDVNGDGKTNQADLTIAAANYEAVETTNSQHLLYGMPRDYDVWQHTRVWMGGVAGGTTTSMLATPAGEVRDMWPTLSPDGKTLAFIRNIAKPPANVPKMGLYTAPVVNGVAGAATLIAKASEANYALAPSWSPDGRRIAFVCSWYDDGGVGDADDIASGYLVDEGHLCLIDANGRNFRNFSQVFNVQNVAKTRIYPPAWASDNEIVYGGAWGSGVCENTLCYANIQNNNFHLFDTDITSSSISPFKVADMPVIRGSLLFYRFYDEATNTQLIRWAQLTPNTYPDLVQPFSARPASGPQLHMIVDFDNNGDAPGGDYLAINDSVDYFNVSTTGNNIIYYDRDTSEFHKSYLKAHAANQPAEWMWPYGGWLDDMVVNPVNPYHTPYNPSDPADIGDLFYAHRNTAEWLP